MKGLCVWAFFDVGGPMSFDVADETEGAVNMSLFAFVLLLDSVVVVSTYSTAWFVGTSQNVVAQVKASAAWADPIMKGVC